MTHSFTAAVGDGEVAYEHVRQAVAVHVILFRVDIGDSGGYGGIRRGDAGIGTLYEIALPVMNALCG
jgi:hypothetical protein